MWYRIRILFIMQILFLMLFVREGSSYLYDKYIHEPDFSNSIYVMTKSNKDDHLSYYEVNYDGDKREIEKFESVPVDLYEVKGCFNSNTVKFNNCAVYLNDKQVRLPDDLKPALESVSSIDKSIFQIDILEDSDEYYVVAELNVNLWNPYRLYKFDKDSNHLEIIHTFDDEKVVGINFKS